MLPQSRQTEAVTTAVPYSVWQHHPHGIGSDRMKDEVGGIVESCTTLPQSHCGQVMCGRVEIPAWRLERSLHETENKV